MYPGAGSFWKDEENRQALKQAHQEKKRQDPNKHNQKWKRRDYNWYHRNTKDCKKLLRKTVCPKFWNLDEMDKFVEKYNLRKLKEGEAESLNRTIMPDEIETVIKKLPKHKMPEPGGFTGEFYTAFKGELTPILHRLFQKIQGYGWLPNSF